MNVVHHAAWILPISAPPIPNGWIHVQNGFIAQVGSHDDRPPEICAASGQSIRQIDHGPVAILPALVNAHTHLEFSLLDQPIGYPGIPLSQWIGEVVRSRGVSSPDRAKAIHRGLQLSHSAGVGLVGEIATLPWLPRDSFFYRSPPSDMDVVVFGEVLGLSNERGQERIAALQGHLQRNDLQSDSFSAAISPHAPYSTRDETVAQAVDLACEHRVPLAMHVAECREERKLLQSGQGLFAAALQQLAVWQPDLFGRGEDATLNLLKTLAAAPSVLLIHGNDLQESEIRWLFGQPQMTVVYCPRTHAYFGHPPHPVKKLQDCGIRVALGTDSLASNPDLSIWNEIRWLLQHRDDLDWHSVLATATIHGATALMRPGFGRIAPGSVGRLIAVPGEVDRAEELPRLWREDERGPVWCV